jgi:hypothetical protein
MEDEHVTVARAQGIATVIRNDGNQRRHSGRRLQAVSSDNIGERRCSEVTIELDELWYIQTFQCD